MIKSKRKKKGMVYKAVPMLQQGGLTMGYGYRDPNKDIYRNIGDSSLYKESITPTSIKPNFGKSRNFDPANIGTGVARVDTTNTVQEPNNLSMGNGLLYSKSGYNVDNGAAVAKVPDITEQTPKIENTVKPENFQLTSSGAAGIAGTANSVIQPALGLLNDKDPTTFTKKEHFGTTAGSTVGGAIAGLTTSIALGAAVGSAFPVVGTVIGAVVGLGIGLWMSKKKKKDAKRAANKRDRYITGSEAQNARKRLVGRDAYVASSAGTTFGGSRRNKREGVPRGYLSVIR